MVARDYRDMIAGVALAAAGAALALYASGTYDLGTLRRMGPGMFPMGLGALLILFGVILFGQSFFREGAMPQFRKWSPIFVLAGVAAFALMLDPFGLVPAIVALTVVSSIAEKRIYPVSLLTLCVGLSLLAVVIFRYGLGLPVALFRWPF